VPLWPFTDTSKPGALYTTEPDAIEIEPAHLWQTIGFITSPAAILKNLATGEVHVEVIGCPNADRFTRLIVLDAPLR
jgi:hypothetical protein